MTRYSPLYTATTALFFPLFLCQEWKSGSRIAQLHSEPSNFCMRAVTPPESPGELTLVSAAYLGLLQTVWNSSSKKHPSKIYPHPKVIEIYTKSEQNTAAPPRLHPPPDAHRSLPNTLSVAFTLP